MIEGIETPLREAEVLQHSSKSTSAGLRTGHINLRDCLKDVFALTGRVNFSLQSLPSNALSFVEQKANML